MPLFHRKPQEAEQRVHERTRQCVDQFTQMADQIDWQQVTDGQSFCAAIAGLLNKTLIIEASHLSADVQGQLMIRGNTVHIIYTTTAPQVLVEHILLHEGAHLWQALHDTVQTVGDVGTYFGDLDDDFVTTALLFAHETGSEQSEEELTIDLLADLIARYIEAYHTAQRAPRHSSLDTDFVAALRRS